MLCDVVKGVFVQWTNDAPNPKVRSWNVTELRVRHSLLRSSSFPSLYNLSAITDKRCNARSIQQNDISINPPSPISGEDSKRGSL